MSRDPRADAIAEIRAKLQAMSGADAEKAVIASLLDRLETPRSASARIQAERVDFARRLLDMKQPRTTIKDRLIARFSVGKSQAHRDINEALQTVPSIGKKWDAARV